MWFIFALLSAVTRAVSQLLRKRTVELASPRFMTFVLRAAALPFVILFGLLFSEFQIPNSSAFWVVIIAAGAIETVATIASFASIKADNLSRVMPIQAFIPVFLVALAFIWSRDVPPGYGVIGVLAVTSGVYLLKLEPGQSPMEPFKRILSDKGSRMMLIYAFLSAIVFLLEKESLRYTNPVTSLSIIYIVQIVLLTPYVFGTNRKQPHITKQAPLFMKLMGGIAFVTAVSHLLQYYAVDAIYASYAFAVQRLDLILILIFSSLFLGEPTTKKIYAAGALCSIGIILLSR